MSQIVRAIDVATHDWTFGASLGNYLSNIDAVVQNINTRLSSFIGNCFFDMGAGINWYSFLSGKGNDNVLLLSNAISVLIINTEDVTGLLQLSFNLDTPTRMFNISYKVQTVYSTTGDQFQYDLGGSLNG